MHRKLRNLPIDHRIRLVDDLWDSIAADQSVIPLSGDQRAALDQRLEAFASDGDRGKTAASVIPAIRKRL